MNSLKSKDCVIWDGPIWSNGRYGADTINGRAIGAHRAAWIREKGPIPKGLLVCHKCDNGLCVNTNHLFLGTQSDNMRDCSRKGRIHNGDQKGANNNNAHPDYVKRNKNIKRDRELGLTYSELRTRYGIKSNGHLRNILKS